MTYFKPGLGQLVTAGKSPVCPPTESQLHLASHSTTVLNNRVSTGSQQHNRDLQNIVKMYLCLWCIGMSEGRSPECPWTELIPKTQRTLTGVSQYNGDVRFSFTLVLPHSYNQDACALSLTYWSLNMCQTSLWKSSLRSICCGSSNLFSQWPAKLKYTCSWWTQFVSTSECEVLSLQDFIKFTLQHSQLHKMQT